MRWSHLRSRLRGGGRRAGSPRRVAAARLPGGCTLWYARRQQLKGRHKQCGGLFDANAAGPAPRARDAGHLGSRGDRSCRSVAALPLRSRRWDPRIRFLRCYRAPVLLCFRPAAGRSCRRCEPGAPPDRTTAGSLSCAPPQPLTTRGKRSWVHLGTPSAQEAVLPVGDCCCTDICTSESTRGAGPKSRCASGCQWNSYSSTHMLPCKIKRMQRIGRGFVVHFILFIQSKNQCQLRCTCWNM